MICYLGKCQLILTLKRKKQPPGTPLVVQWLGLQDLTAKGLGSIPGQGTTISRSHKTKKTKQKCSKLEFSLSKILFSSASLQIVGNLLYYRYMNPAIVAPDGFDIIDMTAGGQINPDQRRNLGSVAKVLQHAASNKLFEGENEHLSSMNDYLSETYQEFR